MVEKLLARLHRLIAALPTSLRKSENQPLCSGCGDYAATVELLSTVPGISWLSALTLAVEIVDFGRFPDGEALSSYAGLTPSEHSSGDRIRHGHITR